VPGFGLQAPGARLQGPDFQVSFVTCLLNPDACHLIPAKPSAHFLPTDHDDPSKLNNSGEQDTDWADHSTIAASTCFLQKEVIQPQVPLGLPCYDFTPVTNHTLAACPLTVSATASGTTNFRGVTGGVYKARERIHRGMLIHDY
jgi:hypothetical protein